jgi:hypothetical protein
LFLPPEEDGELCSFSFSVSCRSVLAALISGEAMEVACRAFFPPAAAAAVPAELQALRDASPVRAVLKKHLVHSLFAHALIFYSGDWHQP